MVCALGLNIRKDLKNLRKAMPIRIFCIFAKS